MTHKRNPTPLAPYSSLTFWLVLPSALLCGFLTPFVLAWVLGRIVLG